MGADIHVVAQKRVPGPQGEVLWQPLEWPKVVDFVTDEGHTYYHSHPFDWRSYFLFGWLADVRNYSDLTPIVEPRGLPEDIPYGDYLLDQTVGDKWGYDPRDKDHLWLGEHSFSWLLVQELLDVDYDAQIEDRRITVQTGPRSWNGGATAEPGKGTITTLRQELGESFFRDLQILQDIGADRIVFGFDS